MIEKIIKYLKWFNEKSPLEATATWKQEVAVCNIYMNGEIVIPAHKHELGNSLVRGNKKDIETFIDRMMDGN